MTAGQNVTIVWEETKCTYGGPFRLAFAAGTADNEGCFNEYVLVSHIPADEFCSPSTTYKLNITVPDIDCPACVLQLTQSDTYRQYSCDGTKPEHWLSFYSCADITITGGKTLADYTHSSQEPALWLNSSVPMGIEMAIWNDGVLATPAGSFSRAIVAEKLECVETDTCIGGLVGGLGQYCNDDNQWFVARVFCVRWWLLGSDIRFEIQAQTRGWAAVGLGHTSFMSCTTLIPLPLCVACI